MRRWMFAVPDTIVGYKWNLGTINSIYMPAYVSGR